VQEQAPGSVLDNAARPSSSKALGRELIIGLTAFLTVVDLFATQAILPSLVRHYQVSPAAMGFAVNACTIGMAVSGLLVALFSRRINRRLGILVNLVALAVPTALLAIAPGLGTFTALRVLQGVFMASAFTLTLAYLGEEYSGAEAAAAFAAYITGNVASNLVGRLVSAGLADHFGLATNFYIFALLNVAGAILVYFSVHRAPSMQSMAGALSSPMRAWVSHLRNRQILAGFGIGFCILFSFIGTFTYVNFVLTGPPLSLSPMQLGLVYFVFLPSIFTTPLAGQAVQRWGTRAALWGGLGMAIASLPAASPERCSEIFCRAIRSTATSAALKC
jgi:MFS transporter, YNFM family, putative membrane transport protein